MITGTQTACVVIPVHQVQLSKHEQAALDRCLKILGKHPVAIFKPESLAIDSLHRHYPQLLVESFPDHFFRSVKDYNRLMLSDEFYARFAAFEFILIHQLDAFVFSDQLLEWCARDYDYIGAPWIPPGPVPTDIGRRIIDLRRFIYRILDRYVDCGDHTQDPQFTYSTGNGGFSLRRISAIRQVLAELDHRAERHRTATIRAWPEDQFFSVEANRYRKRLRIPDAREAVFFSWETNPDIAAQITRGQLPFGCHAWNKLHLDNWRSIFTNVGYSIDDLLSPVS